MKNKFKYNLMLAIILAINNVNAKSTFENLKLNGDIELIDTNTKTNSKTIHKRTSEMNIDISTNIDSNVDVFTTFEMFNGTQGQASEDSENTDDGFQTKSAYVVVPIKKTKLMAGLNSETIFGTNAFDDEKDFWQLGLHFLVKENITLSLISYIENEEEMNSNTGDTKTNEVKAIIKTDVFNAGVKYAITNENKNNGQSSIELSEKEIKTITTYFKTSYAQIDFDLEIDLDNVELIGTNETIKQKGYFAKINKTIGDFSIGTSYTKLLNGKKGGDEFAISLFYDGNIDSNFTNSTNAIAIPIKYQINDKLSMNALFVDINIQGENAKEFDLGLEYIMNDNVTFSTIFGKLNGDDEANIDDASNLEIALAITF